MPDVRLAVQEGGDVSARQEMKQLVRHLEKAGYEVNHRPNGHLRVETPNGPYFMAHSPNGGKRSMQNTIAGLRRKGVEL